MLRDLVHIVRQQQILHARSIPLEKVIDTRVDAQCQKCHRTVSIASVKMLLRKVEECLTFSLYINCAVGMVGRIQEFSLLNLPSLRSVRS